MSENSAIEIDVLHLSNFIHCTWWKRNYEDIVITYITFSKENIGNANIEPFEESQEFHLPPPSLPPLLGYN